MIASAKLHRPKVKTAGILAAGQGQRLHNVQEVPKPMFQLRSMPLIGWSIRTLQAAGIEEIVCITNSNTSVALANYLNDQQLSNVQLIIHDTRSALYSFRSLAEVLSDPSFLFVTVDTLLDPGILITFLDRLVAEPVPDLLLGVTHFVQDESPVWACVDSNWRIIKLGDLASDCSFVTGGVYAGSSDIFRTLDLAIANGIHTLRGYQCWLVNSHYSIYGYDLGEVVDVDSCEDIPAAERLIDRVWGVE
jgi:choline kinase